MQSAKNIIPKNEFASSLAGIFQNPVSRNLNGLQLLLCRPHQPEVYVFHNNIFQEPQPFSPSPVERPLQFELPSGSKPT